MFCIIMIVMTIHGLGFASGICNGTCQPDDEKCGGSYVGNQCPGASNIRCCTKGFVIRDTGFCEEFGVKIITRDSWGARRPRAISNITTPVKDFFIHHTDTPPCLTTSACIKRMKSIQNFHMDDPKRKWSDIAYSFLVGEDGMVYEGRGWDRVGAHTLHYNSVSLAASFIGNYMLVIPDCAALKAAKALIYCGIKRGKISTDYSLFGHRDVGDTTCPGNALYNKIKSWTHFHFHKP